MNPTPLEMQSALLTWVQKLLSNDCIAVTLTFRPYRDGRGVTPNVAQETVRRYLLRLDAAAFGRRAIRGHRSRRLKLQRLAICEGGTGYNDTHVHYHLQIQVPPQQTALGWRLVAADEWRKMQRAGRENTFRDVRDAGWLDYILKLRDKPSFSDAVDFENCWVN